MLNNLIFILEISIFVVYGKMMKFPRIIKIVDVEKQSVITVMTCKKRNWKFSLFIRASMNKN